MRASRAVLSIAIAVLLVGGLGAIATRAETVAYPDPRGDAAGSGHGAGDIYAVGMDYENTLVTIGVAVANPEHPNDWLSSEVTGYIANIDVDGNGTVDYEAFYTVEGGNVYRVNSSTPSCSAQRGFQGDNYFLHFPASCIGNPASFRVRVFFQNDFYDSADFAPNAGFGPFVRRTGGSAPPPPPPTSSTPRGTFDGIIRQPGTATAVGWAVDQDSPGAPVDIHVYSNGHAVAAGKADQPRNDVAAAIPGAGPNHGFVIPVPISGPGPHRICTYAINIGTGTNPQLGCHTITTAPFGSLDLVRESRAGLSLSGWAIDPDTADSIDVHVYVNGSPAGATLASAERKDVGNAHPGFGPNHGFNLSVPIGGGTHNVCAYAIDKVHPHQNTSLGCRRISVTRNPFGSFDGAGRNGSDVTVSGWAADYEAETTTVHVYANGGFIGQLVANQPRPDVGAAVPEIGQNVGFAHTYTGIAPGVRFCIYALNAGPGTNTLLGCHTA